MGDPKISLMIYGTRLSTTGWEPLIMLNNPPFPPLANMGVAGVGENPTYYTFRIDRDYTQYTLIYNPKYIKAHAAHREGALKVSISIPKGYKLDGEASPYNVLLDIQRALETYALNPIVGKKGAFEFKATFPADDVFTSVLDSFKLVETKMPHRPMSTDSGEVGMIIVDEEKEDNLFKDIQYPEFRQYKEIAVVRFGESDNIIKNLEIPREAKYEIIVNSNKATSRFGSYNYGYNDPIVIDTVRYYNLDEKAYEGERIEFTINEALNGKYSELLRVDNERECVEVTINEPKKRKKVYEITLEGVNKSDVFQHLRVYVNSQVRQIRANKTIELIGEELLQPSIDVKIEGTKYQINGDISIKSEKIVVPIKNAPKPKAEINNREWVNPNDNANPNRESSNKAFTFKLVLEDPDDIKNDANRYRVSFEKDDISFSYKCRFKKQQGGTGYFADITIPEDWSDDYSISLETDCVKIATNQSIKRKLGPNVNEVIIKKNDTERLTWRDKMTKSKKPLLQTLIYILILALVAFGAVWINNKFFQNGKVNGDEAPVQLLESPSGNTDETELTKQIGTFLSRLQVEDVSFDEIRNIKSWIDQNLSKLANNNEGIQLNKKVDGYLRVINVIEQPEKRDVENIQQVANKVKSYLEDCHFKYLQNVYSKMNNNNQPVQLQNNEKKAVNNELKRRRTFTSFRDIPSSSDIIKRENPVGGNRNEPEKSGTNYINGNW